MSTNPSSDATSHQSHPADLKLEESASEMPPKTTGSEEDTNPNPHWLIEAIQCPLCARPLKTPIRLPCGKTICRSCLPPLKRREGISYPQGEGRKEGFICPWEHGDLEQNENTKDYESSPEHALADCGVDVVLSKIMDVFERVLQEHANTTTPDIQAYWKLGPYPPIARPSEGENDADSAVIAASLKAPTTSAIIKLGRYLGTYKLSQEGNLPITAKDVVYVDNVTSSEEEPLNDSNAKLDALVLKQLKQGIREELDCQVCYGLIYEPWTSLCGHTFCRDCADRVLDHSNLCPFCRKRMYISSAKGHYSLHDILHFFLWRVFTNETIARREANQADYGTKADTEMPLFVCTLAYPSMLTFLHIFEPRYRLLIRRALDYGNNKFGMAIANPDAESVNVQDNNNSGNDMEHAPFKQYGTIVTIARSEFLPDGRIIVTAMGMSKFKALRWGVTDGYYTAEIERVDDISWEEEENIEAREVAAAAATATTDSNAPSQPEEEPSKGASLESLSTQQLMQFCMDFVEKRSADASPATQRRILGAYGAPPTDPAIFPYWFASALPIPEEEAYKLLPLTSVRERLKLVATWPEMFDSRWYGIFHLL
ncbi:hypothetical protein UA08_07628 [Talaromyces atroroseus]|uniref:RING-type domain-containing protein n=1 Tax=Talaromyces atroroseus TaxID=1441469 RepID=A0A225AGI8_TALAT|nr:hypothetical protein UA08_07628 [Talaromyces atroroseus]OKL57234.1 hypothetical protein UA08_07628 [Talaromyces atroroseus]